ncbi:MAG: transporter substrate-binding domain-containing protein [Amaricoccus sp.]
MYRLLAAAAAAACVASSAPALALTYCVEGAYPPFSQVAPDGSITGFDIDIGMALCKQMGETCTLQKVDWDGIIPALLEKKCDAIMASMSATEERKQVIDFSAKYYQVPNRFVAKADSGLVDTPEGMAGKTVGVQRGTIHQAYMEAHYPDTKLMLYGTQDEADLDLVAGRVDALMADMISLQDGFLKTPAGEGFAFFGEENHFDPAIHGSGAAIGVRKEDTELRDKFSAAILAIRADGTYQAISEKYFGTDIYGS